MKMGRVLNLLYLIKYFFNLVLIESFVMKIATNFIHQELSCQYLEVLRSLVARVQNVMSLAI